MGRNVYAAFRPLWIRRLVTEMPYDPFAIAWAPTNLALGWLLLRSAVWRDPPWQLPRRLPQRLPLLHVRLCVLALAHRSGSLRGWRPAGNVRRRSVHRLKDSQSLADVGSWCDAKPAHKARAQVAHNVTE